MTAPGEVRPPLRDWLVLRDRRPLAAPDYSAPLGRVQGRTKAEAEREAARLHGARVVVSPVTAGDRAREARR